MHIAALSPFVDCRHGTERALAETLERLVRIHGYEVHLYSQRVQDLAVVSSAHIAPSTQPAIIWHRVPSLPGPHLLRFLFWLAANKFCRLRRLKELQGSRSSGGLRDLHRSLYYRLLRGPWRTASIARRTSVWQRFPNTPLTNSLNTLCGRYLRRAFLGGLLQFAGARSHGLRSAGNSQFFRRNERLR